MKLSNNWKQKTIELLENNYWPDPGNTSGLVKRCHALRNVVLDKFTIEDLRIMVGQQIGLDYLIPLVFEILSADLFAEGNFYPGDLLNNILAVDTAFWDNNKNYWIAFDGLIENRRNEVVEHKFDTRKFDKCVYR